MSYKVNVIIPVYNTRADYFAKCVSSLKMQSYANLACWFIDDGSNEQTHQLIDEICNFENAIVVHSQWGGVSHARNVGLKLIMNQNDSLVMFLDSDDYIGVDYIEECVRIFEKTGSDLICTRRTIEWGDGRNTINGYDSSLLENELFRESATLSLVSNHISTSVCGKMYLTNLFDGINFNENISIAEDTALVYKIFEKTKKVYMSGISNLYINRDNGIQSLTRSNWTNTKCLSVIRADKFRLSNLITSFNSEYNDKINDLIMYDCAGNFLEIYPRIDISQLSGDEKSELQEYISFIKSIHLFRYFKPSSIKEKTKKISMIFLGRLYQVLYRPFMKN